MKVKDESINALIYKHIHEAVKDINFTSSEDVAVVEQKALDTITKNLQRGETSFDIRGLVDDCAKDFIILNFAAMMRSILNPPDSSRAIEEATQRAAEVYMRENRCRNGK